MKDVPSVPESLFMLFDNVIVLDYSFQVAKSITYVKVPNNLDDLEKLYEEAKGLLKEYVSILKDKDVPIAGTKSNQDGPGIQVQHRERRVRESCQETERVYRRWRYNSSRTASTIRETDLITSFQHLPLSSER